MTRQKTIKERYVVDRVGEGRGGTRVFKDLSKATRYFYSYDYKTLDGGLRFIAKEISYSLKADENTGRIRITPIGDFPSKKPYFLIDEYTGNYDTYGGEVRGTITKVTQYKTLTQLIKRGLPNVRGKSIVTRGLELKLR